MTAFTDLILKSLLDRNNNYIIMIYPMWDNNIKLYLSFDSKTKQISFGDKTSNSKLTSSQLLDLNPVELLEAIDKQNLSSVSMAIFKEETLFLKIPYVSTGLGINLTKNSITKLESLINEWSMYYR